MRDRPTRNGPKRAKTTTAHHRQTQNAATSTSFSNPTTSIIIPNLPNELSIEILSRLPVKSLLQFKTISKSWHKLISSPNFTKTHLFKSINDPNLTHHHLIFGYKYPHLNTRRFSLHSLMNTDTPPFTNANEVDDPMKDSDDSIWSVVGSVNGLVCIYDMIEYVFLWNPSLRKSKKLPSFYFKRKQEHRASFLRCGFGYDSSNDDYKVVGISRDFRSTSSFSNYETEVKVYSRNSDCWRRIEGFNPGIPQGRLGVFVNGKLHWACRPTLEFNGKWSIVSLDMGDETYGEVEKPEYGEGKFGFELGVLGGWFCVLCEHGKNCADIWVMKEYGVSESWTKFVSFSFSNGPEKHLYDPPLILLGNGKILLVFESKFLLYNPKDDSRRYLEINDFDACPDDVLEAVVYVESLASPDKMRK